MNRYSLTHMQLRIYSSHDTPEITTLCGRKKQRLCLHEASFYTTLFWQENKLVVSMRLCHFFQIPLACSISWRVQMLGMQHSSFLHRHAFSSLNPERTTLENWMHSTTGSPNTFPRSTKELDLSQSNSSNDLNFKRCPTNIVLKLEGFSYTDQNV